MRRVVVVERTMEVGRGSRMFMVVGRSLAAGSVPVLFGRLGGRRIPT